MLSLAFRSKRKANKKAAASVRRLIQPAPSIDSFYSPDVVVEISESVLDSLIHTAHIPRDVPLLDSTTLLQQSPRVDLDFPATEPWFPQDILVPNTEERKPLSGAGSVENHNGGNAANGFQSLLQNGHVSDITHEGAESYVDMGTSDEEEMRPPARKANKGAPAPITIPNLALHGPKIQIQRSADLSMHGSAVPPSAAAHERAISPAGTDSASIISGITLPGALIGNAFSLGSDHRQSRYNQRGVTRQDSATLPHGELSFLNSPYWNDRRISGGGDGVVSSELSTIFPVPSAPPLPHTVAADKAVPVSGGSVKVNNVRQAKGQSMQALDTPPVSGGLKGLLLTDAHAMHRISRITEATSSQTSPASPGRKALGSASTTSSSPAQHQQSATSETDHFLSPSSFASSRGVSPYSNRSGRSGEDIDQVLNESILEKSPSSGKTDITSSTTSATSQGNGNGKQSPDSQTEGLQYPPRSSSGQHVNASNSLYSPTTVGRLEVQVASPSRSNSVRSRSNSASKFRPSLVSVNNNILHPTTLLPIGERPRSTKDIPSDDLDSGFPSSIPLDTVHSAHISQLPSFPVSATFSPSAPSSGRIDGSLSSPDPFDTIVISSSSEDQGNDMRRPAGLNPITVVHDPKDGLSLEIASDDSSPSIENGFPSSTSYGKQTFPETPSAFSPLFSAGLAGPSPKFSPALASGGSADSSLLRTASLNRALKSKSSMRVSQRFLSRSGSSKVIVGRGRSIKGKGSRSNLGASAAAAASSMNSPSSKNLTLPSSRLRVESAAAKKFLLPPPTAQPPTVPSDSSRLDLSEQPQAAAQSRPPSPELVMLEPVPALRYLSIPPQPSIAPPAPPVTPVPPPPTFQEISSSAGSSNIMQAGAPPPYQAVANGPQTAPMLTASSLRRAPRRPPLPIVRAIVPRRTSQPWRVSGISMGSVHSTTPTPKFATTPVKFKGYTIEAAKWTFTSEQLQSIVSRAIKHSAGTSSLRLLPVDQLDNDVPEELDRLEKLQAELKTRYKLQVRKRNMLLATLSNHVDGRVANTQALQGMVEDLQEVSMGLDQIAEDLYHARDQAAQLTKLMVTHSGSALAMALRKLNASFLKRSADVQVLQEHIIALEAERDEAWSHAHQVAQEVDEFYEQFPDSAPQSSRSASRRSSRVLASRKSSLRVSKAGLRSNSIRRSNRASTTSQSRTNSLLSATTPSISPSLIPPVPPIPRAESLGIITTGLSSRNSGYTDFSPSSETRAMVQAQRDLCNMLGISIQDIKEPRGRRSSMSASPLSPRSSIAVVNSRRSVSDIIGNRSTRGPGVLEAFDDLMKNDREVVLATLGIMEP